MGTVILMFFIPTYFIETIFIIIILLTPLFIREKKVN